MFRDRKYDEYRKKEKRTTTRDILNVSTIISSTVVCVKLALWGIFTLETAVLVMIGVVVFVAIGNAYAKLALSLVAVYLLLKSQAGFTTEAFNSALGSMIALLLVLLGIYIMLRSLFR